MADCLLKFILRRPQFVLLVVGLLTAPAVWTLWNAKFAPSIVESFVDDPQDYLRARELNARFASNPDRILWISTVEGDALFTRQTLQRIRQAARQLEQIPEVQRVTCLPDLRLPLTTGRGIGGTTGRIVLNAKLKAGQVPSAPAQPPPVLPLDPTQAYDAAALRQAVMTAESPLRRFVSNNGRAHLMLLELQDEHPVDPSRQIALVSQIEQIVRTNSLGEQGYHCTGLIPLQAAAFEEIFTTLTSLLPIGGALITVAVLWVFHRLEVLLVTLLIAAISICWGIWVGILLFGKLSVLMAAAPLMVLVISTADVIHLASAYTVERRKGLEHARALHKMFSEVGKACVLTSLTTFVGFASLVVVPSNTIRQFGVATATGVASALLLSVVFVPLLLDWLQRRKRPLLAATHDSHLTVRATAACLTVGTARPRTTLVVSLLLLGLAALGASRVRLDPDLTTRFSTDHPIPQSTRFFQQQFAGTNSIELVMKGEPHVLLAPSTLQDILQFSNACQQHGIREVASLAHLQTRFIRQLDYRNPDGFPESLEHSLAVVEFLSRVEPFAVASLITEERDQLRIVFRIQQTSYLTMLQVAEQISLEAQRRFGDRIEIVEKGSAVVVGRAVREIIRGHMQGFLLCFVTIFLLIAWGLRSWRMALLSILPNLTPLLVLGGLLGLLTDVADSDLLAVATLGLGLAVDDTIHFLSRFNSELDEGRSKLAAVTGAMEHTGLAIVRTTLILSVGFLPFALSEYWSINMLGTYLLAVLAAAVLADLILLPAVIVLFGRP